MNPVSLCSPSNPSAKLKRVDLFSNLISSIDNDALHLLSVLQDLILPDNQLAALPRLPTDIEVLDVCLNWIWSWGIKPRAFRVSWGLQSPIDHLLPTLTTTLTHLALMRYPYSNPALGPENQTRYFICSICFIKGSFCCKSLILTQGKWCLQHAIPRTSMKGNSGLLGLILGGRCQKPRSKTLPLHLCDMQTLGFFLCTHSIPLPAHTALLP